MIYFQGEIVCLLLLYWCIACGKNRSNKCVCLHHSQILWQIQNVGRRHLEFAVGINFGHMAYFLHCLTTF